jgi:hypothetical protein
MWKRLQVASVLALIALSAVVVLVPEGNAQQRRPSAPLERTDAAIELRNDMRKLWEDHITWTRCVIISAAHDLPDFVPTRDRLLANQDDIGDAVKPYYGNAAGEQLSTLLKEHIAGAAAILAAAKAGNTPALNAAIAAWYSNANDIAVFLNTANPEQWPLPVLQAQLRAHLDLTLEEATARLGGNFAQDIAKYDAVHLQILGLADILSLGVINQFPMEFRP